MPHVLELQFHKAKAEDFSVWQKLTIKKGHKVNKHSRMCSNHFRYAKPLPGSHIPTLYLSSYPEWAMTRDDSIRAIVSAEDTIARQLLAHLVQYINPHSLLFVARSLCVSPTTRDHIVAAALETSYDTAHKLLVSIAPIVPGGKNLEALQIHKHWNILENTLSRRVLSTCQRPVVCDQQQNDKCDTHSAVTAFHTYASGTEENTEKKRICKRKSCRASQQKLNLKVKKLEKRLESMKTILKRTNTKNHCLKKKIRILQERVYEL